MTRKLLFVSPVGFIGGAERILLECVRQVRALRPDWSVTVLMFAEGPLRDAVVRLGADVEVVSLPSELAAAGDSRFVPVDRHELLKKLDVNEPRIFTLATPAPLPEPLTGDSGERGANIKGQVGRAVDQVGDKKRAAWHRRFFATKISAVGFFWKLQQSIRRIQPDLIHSNALKANLCLSAVPLRGCPVLWHIHDFYSHRPKVQRLVRLASRRATACIAISKAIAHDIHAVAPNLAIHLLENGVDTDHFQPGEGDPLALDRAAGFLEPTSDVRVGLVATYANWKGHDVFLRAIAWLPNVRAVIVGGPIYTTAGSQWTESELRAKVRELGITDRVGFIPFQPDPCWIYRSLDVVVHASTRPEPFGLTIAEAMACARPVVFSASGGANDLFTDQWDAIGHVSGDVESLASAIEQLSNDANLRQVIGSRARQTAVERFSMTRFGSSLVDIYESVIAKDA